MKQVSLIKLMLSKRTLSFIILISAFVFSASEVLATLQISRAIDSLVGKGDVKWESFYNTVFLLIIIYILCAISNWVVSSLSIKLAFNITNDLRHKLFEKMQLLPLSYFDSKSSGEVLSRFTGDINNISDALSAGLSSAVTGIVSMALMVVIMLFLDIRLTIIVLLVTPFTFVVARAVSKQSQKTFAKQQESIGKITGFINEIIGNEKTVKMLGYELKSVEVLEEMNNHHKDIAIPANFASAMINPSSRIIDHFAYIIVGVFGALIAINNNVSVGILAAFLIYAGQFSKPINEISGIMTQIQVAKASLERVNEMLNAQEEAPDSSNAIKLSNPDGLFDFVNVDFSYSKFKKLIVNLNQTVKPGQTVAIVGPTGAGKTTIVNLLMRFYNVDNGEILLDGNDIQNITRDSLRKSFGMVLQDTWLFKGTIRENISYGNKDVTDEEIVLAAKATHAHSFIKQLSDGYDTIISEDGGNMSQGQKQLITIARVMLSNPAFLILDEATSSIDTLTEIRVQKAFLSLMNGRTSFVIAHRLSTIINADVIWVLEKGNIVETGTHKELLEKDGVYSELYNSQFK